MGYRILESLKASAADTCSLAITDIITMVISNVTEEEYRSFLSEGGSLTFEIDVTDIELSGRLEQSPRIGPIISSSFGLQPSPVMENSKEVTQFLQHGDSWARVVAHVYKNGGSVIYKKLPTGRYEAKVSIPSAR
jgi:hypothetical protein